LALNAIPRRYPLHIAIAIAIATPRHAAQIAPEMLHSHEVDPRRDDGRVTNEQLPISMTQREHHVAERDEEGPRGDERAVPVLVEERAGERGEEEGEEALGTVWALALALASRGDAGQWHEEHWIALLGIRERRRGGVGGEESPGLRTGSPCHPSDRTPDQCQRLDVQTSQKGGRSRGCSR
jgi:hypothetical protein